MHRRITDEEKKTDVVDDDGDVEMTANKATTAKSGTLTKGMRHTQHGETPIDSYKYVVQRPFPLTTTVHMPFHYISAKDAYTIKPNSSTAALKANKITFRLNSIYDIYKSSNFAANDSDAAADTADASPNIEVPIWRKYWMDKYRMWTVIKSGWTFRIRKTDTPRANESMELFTYLHGREQPPTIVAGGTTPVTLDYRRMHHTLYDHGILKGRGTGDYAEVSKQDYNNNWSSGWDYQVSGNWEPGSIDHEVYEDEFMQTWHKATEVPPTPELVSFIIQKSMWDTYWASQSTGEETCEFQYEFIINYVVQLKDLVYIHQYVDEASDIAANADYASRANL